MPEDNIRGPASAGLSAGRPLASDREARPACLEDVGGGGVGLVVLFSLPCVKQGGTCAVQVPNLRGVGPMIWSLVPGAWSSIPKTRTETWDSVLKTY